MKLKLTHSIERAAVKSGFSRDSYRINKDRRLPSQKPKVPRGRRRSDPLAGIFEEQVVPMLEQCPNLRAVSVYEEIMRLNPQLEPGVRRTLERRVRAGERSMDRSNRMGISDFTDMNRIGVTIGGCKFDHKLYHFVGIHSCRCGSGWREFCCVGAGTAGCAVDFRRCAA